MVIVYFFLMYDSSYHIVFFQTLSVILLHCMFILLCSMANRPMGIQLISSSSSMFGKSLNLIGCQDKIKGEVSKGVQRYSTLKP